MNTIYRLLLFAILFPMLSFGQKKKDRNYSFLKIPNIQIDGDLQEWEGKFFNPETQLWQGGVAIQDGKLYAAVVVKDEMLQVEAIRNGIVLNLSYDSKKKDGAQLIFPVGDRESIRALLQDEDRDKKNIKHDVLNSVRGYHVKGFSKVVDGLLSFQNEYGIKAVARLDSNGHLLYEAVVPLDLIKFKTNEIAVQLAVNTQHMQLQKINRHRQAAPMGSYGVYRQSGSSIKNPYKEKTEIWVIGPLK